MHLLMLLIIGLTGPRNLTSKPSAAHCLEFIGDEDVCIDGFSADDIDAPEPWPGEAVYLIDGLWQRTPDDGPQPC